MENNNQTPQEILQRTHADLKDGKASTRLAAIKELLEQKFSSPAILRTLEKMAINDKSKPVREAAFQALNSPTHRYIQQQVVGIKSKDRRAILGEIEAWERDGLLQTEQADVLRQRYDFAQRSASHLPEEKPASVKETTATPQLEASAKESSSLAQTLLSETSIKIALYLGAFFVIAAAAILAAVIEAARIPILFVATALFGGSALITKKRLPQPSFALFVVFSFLLPTDANVLADVLNLTGTVNAGYWFAIMMGLALIWSFGTWFYSSRLFSLAAFVALGISVIRLGEAFDAEPELYAFLLVFVALIGLGGTYLLKRWQSAKFSLPLFILVQVAQFALNIFALIVIFMRVEDFPNTWNLVSALYWLLATGFYVISNLVFPFVLFPWLAATTLYPVSLVFMAAFDVKTPAFAISTWIWGAILAASGELARILQKDKVQRYSLPLLVVSILSILTATLIGFIENNSWGFAVLLSSTILYAIVQIFKPRVYIWTTALILGLGAYFSFFTLPFMEQADVFVGYQFLGASLLLLLPDLFLKPDFSADKNWRRPLQIIGGLLALLNLSFLLPLSMTNPGQVAVAYSVYTIFFALYALKFNTAWLGFIATASGALAAIFTLQHFDLDFWVLTLTSLAALYFLLGFMLGRNEQRIPWSNMLRFSGLALGGLISLIAAFVSESNSGWYALITAVLFGIEMFSRHASWGEAGLQIFFATGVFTLLHEADVAQNYQWLSISLVLLGTDLTLARTYTGNRRLAWPARGLGALVVLFNTLDILFNSYDTQVGAICFSAYMAFFLIQTLLYRLPILGYDFILYSVLTVIQTLKVFDLENWLLPVTALATIYYGAGFFSRKRKSKNDEQTQPFFSWSFVLWTGGLGAGLLATIVAPVQGGLSAAIPVAVTATMVTVEAFERRNVWLGFPANALYLMAYFILLIELNVDEPQFFSIATAALGMLMHYLLTRAGSRTGAFVTGMVSQLVLLGTTYIQFVSTEKMIFFGAVFFQAIIVTIYGLIIRSRSLVITPIIIAVISVITVMFGWLQGIGTIIMIGCTGLILLLLGILAVIMRDRLKQISERFSDWEA